MTKDRPSAEDIRLRAYFHWLREGKPHGHDKEHWALAEDEVNSEEKALKPGERDVLPNPFDQES